MPLVRLGVLLVVDEVPGVPDHHVGAVDRLAVMYWSSFTLVSAGCPVTTDTPSSSSVPR